MCFCWATNAISTHFIFGTLSWSNFGWPTSHDPHLKASPQNEAASAARMTFRHTESTLNSVRLSMYFWQASKCDPSFLSGVSGGPLVLLRVVAGRSWRWPVDFSLWPWLCCSFGPLIVSGLLRLRIDPLAKAAGRIGLIRRFAVVLVSWLICCCSLQLSPLDVRLPKKKPPLTSTKCYRKQKNTAKEKHLSHLSETLNRQAEAIKEARHNKHLITRTRTFQIVDGWLHHIKCMQFASHSNKNIIGPLPSKIQLLVIAGLNSSW